MKYHLFEVVGIELEYMVVHSRGLKVHPVVDWLLTRKNGSLCDELENGPIAWSNELVGHVVELKTNGPAAGLQGLEEIFTANIREINHLLKSRDSRLLPTAAHPLMDPAKDTVLWKHGHNAIYALYDRIFDCRGHGWSNLQSMHLNLPFFDDAEFERLHAAIRLLLPLMPGLSASSPILDGRPTGLLDSRLEVYKTNQKEIPQMTGKVIPEAVFSKRQYQERIFDPIDRAIRPYDTEGVLDHHFLNSRGAIARFDRNAIEIRIIDIQECPAADLAIAALILESLKLLVEGQWMDLESQKKWGEEELFELFDQVIRDAGDTLIRNNGFLQLFGFSNPTPVSQIWISLYQRVRPEISVPHQKTIEFLLENGCLSSRILRRLNGDWSRRKLVKVYSELGDCLRDNQLFIP